MPDKPKPRLSHFDDDGQARMVDVGDKAVTERVAVASGAVFMGAETLALVKSGTAKKGDVLGTARIAAIQGLKRTSELIPLCHPVRVVGTDIAFVVDEAGPSVKITATVRAKDRTGVEMEALTAVQVTLLTIYDMCKAVDRGMHMEHIGLLKKSGGKSGDWSKRD